MTGRWAFSEQDSTCAVLTITYQTDQMHHLYFYCKRGLAGFKVLDYNSLQNHLGKLGPDLLKAAMLNCIDQLSGETLDKLKTDHESVLYGAEGLTYKQWKVITDRSQRCNITSFLMNQEKFSGIGNYLKAEILFACRISPKRTMGSLTEQENQMLWIISLTKIWLSYWSNGLTISDYWDPEGKAGVFPMVVYGKDVYKENGLQYVIQRDKFADGRTTHWVPELQH